MIEFFNMFVDLFSQFISFLDSFYLIGQLSILKILFILFLFSISFNFLIKRKKGD